MKKINPFSQLKLKMTLMGVFIAFFMSLLSPLAAQAWIITGKISPFTISSYNNSPGATSVTYIAQFSVETAIQDGDKVVLHFPAGFDFSNVTSGDINLYASTGMNGYGTPSIDTGTNTITVPVGTITGTVTDMGIYIYNVTNAPTEGFYQATLSTTTSTDSPKDTGKANFTLAASQFNFYYTALGSGARDATTNYDLYFYDTLNDQSKIRLQFPPESDLSGVGSNDITPSLSTASTATVDTIDNTNKYIEFTLDIPGGPHINNGTFSVANVKNPSTGGTYPLTMTVMDNSSTILASGQNSFYIDPPQSISLDVGLNTPLVSTSANYTVKYTPANPIDNNWKVRAIFPAGTDLSNVTAGDVSITGATFDTPTVTIDDTNHYVELTVAMPGGDSGGNELTLQINNVINAPTANTYQLLLEEYNPSSLLMDSGSGDFDLANGGNAISPIDAYVEDAMQSKVTRLHYSYTTPSLITNGWTLEYEFDPSVDLSLLDPNDIYVYGSYFDSSTPVIDAANHKIIYTVNMPNGNSGHSGITLYIEDFTNPNTPGSYPITVTQKDPLGNVIDQGTGHMNITSNLIIQPDKNQRLMQTYYNLTYHPVHNISDGYYIKVYFPNGVDLSNTADNDVSYGGYGFNDVYFRNVDPVARTVEMRARFPSSNAPDSNGSNLYMYVYNVINPSVGGDLPVMMEISDSSHTLVETLNGILTIAGEGVITPTVTLSDDVESHTSTYTIHYVPAAPLDSNWIINLDFPAGTDLSNVTSGDISMTGGPYGTPTLTVDNTNHRISLLTYISSGNSYGNPVDLVINNIINTTPPGVKALHVTELTDKGLLADSGTGNFTITGSNPSVGLIDPVSIDTGSPLINETGNTYQVTYTPPTNIDNNWKVLLTFPNQYDLSAITAGDVSIAGTNITGTNSVTIDDSSKTILLDISTTGDSSGNPITVSINSISNVNTANSYAIMVQDLDPSSTLVDQGSGTFVLTASANNIPTAASSLYVNTQTNGAQTGRTDPMDLDSTDLRFSAIFSDPDAAPSVTTSPTMNATGVSPTTSIEFDFTDPGSGINNSNLYITVDGNNAISGGVCETGYTCNITPITDGIHVSITPDTAFGTNQTVNVDYYAEDLSPLANYVNSTLTFTTGTANALPGAPTNLFSNTQTNTAQSGSTNPTNLDSTNVVFSGIYNDADASDTATKYELDIATDNTFTNIIYGSGQTNLTTPVSVGNRSEDIGIPGGTLSIETPYYWRLRFIDNNGGVGTFSPAASFMVADTTAPTLTSSTPTSAATNVSIGTNIVLNLSDTETPLNTATINVTIGGTNAIVNGVCQTGYACTITPTGNTAEVIINPDTDFAYSTNISVNYSVSDSATVANTLNSSFSFTTEAAPNNAPSAPTGQFSNTQANTAQSGSTDPTNLNSTSIVVSSIFQDTDASDTATKYRVEVATDNTFSTITYDSGNTGTALTTPVAVGNRSEDIALGGTINVETTYYWRIKFWDNNNAEGTYSSTSTFMVADSTAPTLTSSTPTASAANVLIGNNIVLNFSDTETPINTSAINVTVGGVNAIVNGVCQTGYACTITPTGNTAEVSINPDTDFAYSTNVSVNYSVSDSATVANTLNSSFSFTTEAEPNVAPSAPTSLFSNTQTATAQTGQTNPVNLNSLNIALSALYADSNAGDTATKYRVQVATDDTFSSIVYESGAAGTTLASSITVGNRSEDLVIPTALDYETTYYWRVKFWDNSNTEGTFSPSGGSAAYFMIPDVTAPVLDSSTPTDNATTVPSNTNITLNFSDADTAVDENTLNVTVGGTNAIVNGVCQTGYACTITPTGNTLQAIINPDTDLAYATNVTVNYSVKDTSAAANTLSGSFDFTTEPVPNYAPTAPTNLYSNTQTNTAQSGNTNPTNLNSTSVVFSGIYNDANPADTATQYTLDIATDSGFTNIIYASGTTNLTTPVAVGNRSEDITVPNGTVNVEVPYYWRLSFVDNNGAAGASSSTANFMIADSTAPTLTSSTPTTSATNVLIGNNIVLNFSDTETPINTATINVTIGGTNAIVNGVCQTGYACTITPTGNTAEVTVNPDTDLAYSTNVSVNYSVSDSATVANTLNSSFSFTTEAAPNTAPSAPTGLFSNTATNTAQSGSTNPTNLNSTSVVVSSIFQDSDSSDTAVKYQIQVATDNTFSTIVYDSGAAGTTLTTPVAVGSRSEDIAIPGGSLTLETPYYWRVKFWDNSNTPGTFSSTANFMIADLVPPVLASNTPTNTATSISTTSAITLNFTDADTAINTATINVSLSGIPAIVNGICQAGYTCTISPIPDGQKVVTSKNTPFGNSTNINVNYSVSDSALVPNTLNSSFSFTTQAAPASSVGGGGSGGSGGGYPMLPPANANQNLRSSPENSNTNTAPVINQNQNIVQNQNTNILVNANQNAPQNANQNLTQPDLAKRPNTISPSITGVPYEQSVCTVTQNTNVTAYSDFLDTELQNYIAQLNRYGIRIDSTNSKFLPTAPVTRSEILKYVIQGACEMYRTEVVNTAPFPDVPVTHKDAYFVNVAKENEIVTGYLSDGTYKPDRPISRAEALKVMIEVFTSYTNVTIDGKSEPFTDVNDDEWYAPYIRFAYEQHIISDTPDHKFNPNLPATREEIAEFLAKSLILKSGNVKSPEDLKPSANANQNTAPVNNKNTNTSDTPDDKTPANGNTNSTIPQRTILKEGTVPYKDSVCPSIESKTKTTYTDLSNKDLAKFVELLIKSGVAFSPVNGKFDENATVERSELLRFVIEGNCEDFKLETIKKAPFPDVPVTHKDVFFIYAAKLRSIISGYLTDGTYKPNNDISRAEALKIILEVTLGDGKRTFTGNAQTFTDISWNDPLAWYRGYVSYAIEKGIIAVGPDKKFRPNDKATRKEIIYFLTQALNIKNR